MLAVCRVSQPLMLGTSFQKQHCLIPALPTNLWRFVPLWQCLSNIFMGLCPEGADGDGNDNYF